MQLKFSNRYTIFFVVIICIVCASVLSVITLNLRGLQEEAEELYNSQQLLIAARLLSHDGYFTVREGSSFVHATLDDNKLIPNPQAAKPSASSILAFYQSRVEPLLTDKKGELLTFEKAGVDFSTYIEEHKKKGFADLEYKLLYRVKNSDGSLYGYVIPVNGFGLWDAIYGYICLAPDAQTVIGTAWYDQKETPGLGAEISTAEWQDQFTGKVIIAEGKMEGPIGINVVKMGATGSNEVDGIAGATVTSKGVAEAYRQSLSPYRDFLINAHAGYAANEGGK